MPVDKDEARLIAETVVAHLKAEFPTVFVTAAAPATAAPVKAAKPTPAAKAPAAPKTEPTATVAAVTRDEVHAALRDYSNVDGKPDEARRKAALDLLHEFGPRLADIPVADYPKILDGLKALETAPASPAGDDPF